jgi:predicted RNase H-like HicB family nuclease
MPLKFPIIYHKEDKWYVAYCPDLGVTSQGETLEEAKANIRQAVELYLEDVPAQDLKGFTSSPFIETLDIVKV